MTLHWEFEVDTTLSKITRLSDLELSSEIISIINNEELEDRASPWLLIYQALKNFVSSLVPRKVCYPFYYRT